MIVLPVPPQFLPRNPTSIPVRMQGFSDHPATPGPQEDLPLEDLPQEDMRAENLPLEAEKAEKAGKEDLREAGQGRLRAMQEGFSDHPATPGPQVWFGTGPDLVEVIAIEGRRDAFRPSILRRRDLAETRSFRRKVQAAKNRRERKMAAFRRLEWQKFRLGRGPHDDRRNSMFRRTTRRPLRSGMVRRFQSSFRTNTTFRKNVAKMLLELQRQSSCQFADDGVEDGVEDKMSTEEARRLIANRQQAALQAHKHSARLAKLAKRTVGGLKALVEQQESRPTPPTVSSSENGTTKNVFESLLNKPLASLRPEELSCRLWNIALVHTGNAKLFDESDMRAACVRRYPGRAWRRFTWHQPFLSLAWWDLFQKFSQSLLDARNRQSSLKAQLRADAAASVDGAYTQGVNPVVPLLPIQKELKKLELELIPSLEEKLCQLRESLPKPENVRTPEEILEQERCVEGAYLDSWEEARQDFVEKRDPNDPVPCAKAISNFKKQWENEVSSTSKSSWSLRIFFIKSKRRVARVVVSKLVTQRYVVMFFGAIIVKKIVGHYVVVRSEESSYDKMQGPGVVQ